MVIHAKEVRSEVSGAERDLIFLPWNKEQLCSSQINKAIHQYGKRQK